MNPNHLPRARVRRLLAAAARRRILVLGDVMLDQFIWGRVSRISPEAPVPVVEFDHESFMPGGAANVARNLTALGAAAELFALIGPDAEGARLRSLLERDGVDCRGLVAYPSRPTSVKTRILAQRQQVVRLDREVRADLDPAAAETLLRRWRRRLPGADAVIVGDYGKGVVTQAVLDAVREACRRRGVWLSLDPKPVHALDLSRLSLLTPNRKEAFELAHLPDPHPAVPPREDPALRQVAHRLLESLQPALLLITLGEHGMLLCPRDGAPRHIPTVAREVFDVSGAGDTVIAAFTLAVAAGASPVEAAVFSNHAAGVVVGKLGTATVSPAELLASFDRAA